tara:strand:+ start:317 stop:694 length:378 start_codon:yes stop_codon:yes gene_type:complete
MKDFFKWIKSVILWMCVADNREIGIAYTKKLLDVAEIVAASTKTKRDDKALLLLNRTFKMALEKNNALSKVEIEKAAKAVKNITTGSLKDVDISLSGTKKINMYINNIGASYDMTDGSIRLGMKR